MDQATIISVSALILSIASLIISIFDPFINWKKYKRETPKIKASVVKSSYKKNVNENRNRLLFKFLIQFENIGQAPGSITDLKAFIRYPEELFKQCPQLKYQITKFLHSASPTNIDNNCPFGIKANGAIKKEFEFAFEDIIFEYIDRCQMPINFRDPKKWEWEDLPIFIRLVAKTSSGEIEFFDCSFSVDQEESKMHHGFLNYNPKYGGPMDNFSPKIDFDE